MTENITGKPAPDFSLFSQAKFVWTDTTLIIPSTQQIELPVFVNQDHRQFPESPVSVALPVRMEYLNTSKIKLNFHFGNLAENKTLITYVEFDVDVSFAYIVKQDFCNFPNYQADYEISGNILLVYIDNFGTVDILDMILNVTSKDI